MICSDLIDELNCGEIEKQKLLKKNCTVNKKLKYSSYYLEFNVKTQKDVEDFGKPLGDYFLINKIKTSDFNENKVNYYAKVLCGALINMLKKNITDTKVLVVGLGNDEIQCDSLGVRVCDKLSRVKERFEGFYVYETNVFGKTGIESYEIVEAIVKKKKIDIVIVIDSLCAGAEERLNASIQLTNAGISPGSGVMNSRKIICKKNLNCEVFAIGVPLMIYSSSFIYSALKSQNIDYDELTEKQTKNNIYGRLIRVLQQNNSLIVAASNIRVIVEIYSDIIFKAILKFLLFT